MLAEAPGDRLTMKDVVLRLRDHLEDHLPADLHEIEADEYIKSAIVGSELE